MVTERRRLQQPFNSAWRRFRFLYCCKRLSSGCTCSRGFRQHLVQRIWTSSSEEPNGLKLKTPNQGISSFPPLVIVCFDSRRTARRSQILKTASRSSESQDSFDPQTSLISSNLRVSSASDIRLLHFNFTFPSLHLDSIGNHFSTGIRPQQFPDVNWRRLTRQYDFLHPQCSSISNS